MQRKALGKGLEALFRTTAEDQETDKGNSRQRIINIPLNDIIPNRNQPRERFSDEAMEDLKQSIAENGIIEPPIVRRKDEFYELIAGERRFRAAKELNFETIDVILMDVESDDKILVLSLIENIQREDLNAIEEGKAYQQIMNRMGITQEKLAGIVGYSQLALDQLPEDSRAKPDVNRVLDSAYRAKDLVKQILLFSQRSEGERQSMALHLILAEVLELLRPVIPTTIEIRTDIHKDCGWILADMLPKRNIGTSGPRISGKN